MQFIKQEFFRGAFIPLSIMLFLSAPNVKAQEGHNPRVNIGLAYPFSSNGSHAAADTNLFSFNLIAGLSAAETGFSFAGISSVVKQDAKGMQFAGFSNHIFHRADGFTFAGFTNKAADVKGSQFAGFINVAKKSMAFR